MLGDGGDGGYTWDGSDNGGGSPGPGPTPGPDDPPTDDPDEPPSDDPDDPPTDDPPPEDPPAPPQLSTRLWVFYTSLPLPSHIYYSWWWVARDVNGGSWSVCDANNDRPCNDDAACNNAPDPNDDGSAPLPDGSYEMFRGRAEGCTYEGNGVDAGTLMCPGFSNGPVRCTRLENPQYIPCFGGAASAGYEETVYCEY